MKPASIDPMPAFPSPPWQCLSPPCSQHATWPASRTRTHSPPEIAGRRGRQKQLPRRLGSAEWSPSNVKDSRRAPRFQHLLAGRFATRLAARVQRLMGMHEKVRLKEAGARQSVAESQYDRPSGHACRSVTISLERRPRYRQFKRALADDIAAANPAAADGLNVLAEPTSV